MLSFSFSHRIAHFLIAIISNTSRFIGFRDVYTYYALVPFDLVFVCTLALTVSFSPKYIAFAGSNL